MKRLALPLAALVLAVTVGGASAAWQTIVIPNMEPIMIGNETPDWAIFVSCTKPEDVTISFIQKNAQAPAAQGATLAVQADTDQNYTFDAVRYAHNDDFVGFKSIWTDYATLAVQAMGAAQGSVSLHLKYAGGGAPVTYTVGAQGATGAVGQLLTACGALD